MSNVEPRKPAADADGSKEPVAWWKFVLVGRWIVVVVVASLVVHGTLFLLLRKSTVPPTPLVEQTVGTFHFLAAGTTQAAPAKFDLHIRFIDDLDRTGRQRLAAHQFRVRESVENLLRKAQTVELSDQSVARLKHEIQERIDGALDVRAVAEVILTNLQIDSPPISVAPTVAADAILPSKPAEPASILDAH